MSSNPAASDRSAISPGEKIGPYCVESEIGAGGMADVYYAVHEGLQRPAAIKVLRASLAADKTNLQRFMQEARAAASLVHPNIVQVYDVGQEGPHQYIAQEYIPGSNLRQYLASGRDQTPADSHGTDADSAEPGRAVAGSDDEIDSVPFTSRDQKLDVSKSLSILTQILAALNKSFSAGIVHRDIKPENIMLTKEGEVKVADFGLARTLLGDDPQLTRAGTTLGTPLYMSPEQIQDGEVDIRSDLYSLGVTLYHMLAGRPPFLGETPLALAMKHVQNPVPDIRELRDDLPDSLVEFVERLLAKKPQDRFDCPSSALAFLREHRQSDLQAVWPEHTVPLPEAGHASQAGPLQATLMLEAKLRERRAKGRWATLLATGAGALLAFVAGAAWTFERPFDLENVNAPIVFKDVVKESSVQEQYLKALLSEDGPNRSALWEAVSYYFPENESELNRIYSGLSSVQLARVLQDKGDFEAAKNQLQKTISDEDMEQVYKALAYLQLAAVEEERGQEDAFQDAVRKAYEMSRDIGGSDTRRLSAYLELTSWKTQQAWAEQR